MTGNPYAVMSNDGLLGELRRNAANNRRHGCGLAAQRDDAAAERIDHAARLLDRIHAALTTSDAPDLTGLLAEIGDWLDHVTVP